MHARGLGTASRGASARPSSRLAVTMQLQVIRWDAAARGPVSRDKVLRQLREEGFSCTTYTFSPGTVFGEHSHQCDKKDSIIAGRFRFRMGGEEVVLEAGDMLLVPKNSVHSAEVVGSEPCEFVDASRLG